MVGGSGPRATATCKRARCAVAGGVLGGGGGGRARAHSLSHYARMQWRSLPALPRAQVAPAPPRQATVLIVLDVHAPHIHP